jgi:[ribosomal protein S18]-alanine N-acetyltransferase
VIPQLRKATEADAAAMAALEARATAYAWSESLYADSIHSHHCWVLEDDRQLLGLLIFSRVLDEMELLNIVVDPKAQGQGYGRQLLNFLVEQGRQSASRIFLEVRESNAPAIGLYQRVGFTLSGLRKNYYPADNGRENAVLMTYEYD